MTVGNSLLPLSPVKAPAAVIAHPLVLFIFASQCLEAFLQDRGLLSIPLVPVSSSQALVGAVLGIALINGGSEIHWRILRSIGFG